MSDENTSPRLCRAELARVGVESRSDSSAAPRLVVPRLVPVDEGRGRTPPDDRAAPGDEAMPPWGSEPSCDDARNSGDEDALTRCGEDPSAIGDDGDDMGGFRVCGVWCGCSVDVCSVSWVEVQGWEGRKKETRLGFH